MNIKEVSIGNNVYPIKDANAADKDLSNLSATGEKHFLNKQMISNCITEIPQDIKLELNNGTLTLKAGSKVYVPNGPSVFDVVNITTDRTPTSGTLTGKFFIFITSSNFIFDTINIKSGGTFPSSAISGDKFYNTTENKFYRYSGSEWQSNGYSFPLAIVTLSSGSVTSIDQVFNGFGYIGSTAFALPGVKGLIPNGRNADGSLKNTEVTITNVSTTTFPSTYTYSGALMLAYNTLVAWGEGDYSYDEEENFVKFRGGNYPAIRIGSISLSSGNITFFQSKTPFHALDYNDKSTISGFGMPDVSRVTNITLSEGVYTNWTAPIDCELYILVSNGSTARNLSAEIDFGNNKKTRNYIANTQWSTFSVHSPVARGQTVKLLVSYSETYSAFYIPEKGAS